MRRLFDRNVSTYGNRGGDALYEHDSLELDDNEVDELADIANQAINGVARYGYVATGPELGGKASVEQELSSDLGSDGNGKGH